MGKTYKIFNSEKEAIEQLELNRPRRLRIGDQKIVLIRSNTGYHAMNDQCPHQFASLSEGFVNDFGEIICPLHEYRFHLQTGQESSGRCSDANVYPILIKPTGVFVIT